MMKKTIVRVAMLCVALMLPTTTAWGQCPGAGNCFVANGTPGCVNTECCESVCAIDPFCCNVSWDGICASEALALCTDFEAACCLPSTTCLELTPPACGALGGEFVVGTCADAVCPEPAIPTGCVDAIPIGPLPATVSGSTVGLMPSDAEDCGTTVTAAGVWYTLIGTGNEITLTTCAGQPGGGTANYDSKISVYCGGCESITCVAGNDDGAGCANFQSSVTFCSRLGAEYQVLVHGFQADQGDFTLGAFDNGAPCDATILCPTPFAPRPTTTEKGSLLFVSGIDLRFSGGAGPAGVGAVLQDTFISLTNDFPEDVKVQMYLINGDPPLPADPVTGERAHPGWNYVDNTITLTGDQPTYWSVLTGSPATGGVAPFTSLDPGFPPGRPANDGTNDRVLRGYLVMWAVNDSNEEIRWNHLSATATTVNYGLGCAWEAASANHRVVDPAVAHGQPTGTPGTLNLNGVEYSESFAQLLLNFQAPSAAAFSGPRQVISDTSLTLHPVFADLRQEGIGPITTKANFNVWNMNEVKFSGAHRCITCWDQTRLSQFGTPNNFILGNLQTAHGKARIDGLASQECNIDAVFDDGACGVHPNDVCSMASPLIGVSARFLTYDGGMDHGAAGVNLIGLGTENTAVIRYDVLAPPPEGEIPSTPELLIDWLERAVKSR